MIDNKALYDSFNARYLDYDEIAELFIINKQYLDLLNKSHSLLMGPRGSGKTTLLKMLTIPAQYYWKEKTNNLNSPPFAAIYIPTDVHWKKQIDDFEKEFNNKPKYKSIVTRLIVTTNILISTCDTFKYLTEFKDKSKEDLNNEADLSMQLIQDWKLTKPISTNFTSIKHSLLGRLREINSHIKKVRTLNIPEDKIEYPEYFYDEYLDLVSLGCNAFENIYKNDIYFNDFSFRWALCFDELEIAPRWLQNELLGMLRSLPNQKILFKLTMVPLVLMDNKDNFGDIIARETQDFKIIRTWSYSHDSETEWRQFARKLIQDKFRRKFNNKINPLSLFGISNLDRNIEATFKDEEDFIGRKGYGKGTYVWYLFKELAAIDRSFKLFLESKKIHASNPIPLNDKQESEIHRKIKPIALHRYQFKSRHILGKKRSRKNPALYYGTETIYTLCDGNPRALIGLIDEFLEKLIFNANGIVKSLEINFQSRIITEISEKYLALLYNHPDSNVKYHTKYLNLGTLLERIGKYFESKLIDGEFNMDPVNCFTVDKETPDQVIELLNVAMHLGAIIYLDPDESISKRGLIGKKFRLSYLLFPHFHLPTVEYKDTRLSTILKKGTDKIDQLLLFEIE